MRKKIITLAAVATASAGLAGVVVAQASDTPQAPTSPTAQTMRGHMDGGRDMMGQSMSSHMRNADHKEMAKGMGMKLDAASVKQMMRMHNGMGSMDEAGAMNRQR